MITFGDSLNFYPTASSATNPTHLIIDGSGENVVSPRIYFTVDETVLNPGATSTYTLATLQLNRNAALDNIEPSYQAFFDINIKFVGSLKTDDASTLYQEINTVLYNKNDTPNIPSLGENFIENFLISKLTSKGLDRNTAPVFRRMEVTDYDVNVDYDNTTKALTINLEVTNPWSNITRIMRSKLLITLT